MRSAVTERLILVSVMFLRQLILFRKNIKKIHENNYLMCILTILVQNFFKTVQDSVFLHNRVCLIACHTHARSEKNLKKSPIHDSQ